MKYEKIVKMHKIDYLFWENIGSFGNSAVNDFTPKKEYTIFDLLSYVPAVTIHYVFKAIWRIWNHRKKWVIAKDPSVLDNKTTE